MHIKYLLPASLGALTSAQSLTEAIASQNASLSTLNGLLSAQPALLQTLGNTTNITILAPSNDAFAAFLNSTSGQAASRDPSAVANLLTYHVLNGNFLASAITSTPAFVPSLLTNTSFTNVTGGQRVEAVANVSEISFYSGLLQKSTVTTGNLNFTGGVIHIIDRVLTIPEPVSSTAIAANLTSLAGALTSANLVSAVDSLRDVTIFAPSNSAFQAIGSALSTLSTEQLSSILTYHVVNGTVGYSSLLSNTTLPTLGGGSVTITVADGAVFVNSARVTTPNVLVAGGVVHVIDSVLNPNATTATPAPSGSSTAPVYSGASSVANVPFTSGISASTTIGSGSTPTGAGGAGGASSSSSSAGAAMVTGAVGMGTLFGMGVWANL